MEVSRADPAAPNASHTMYHPGCNHRPSTNRTVRFSQVPSDAHAPEVDLIGAADAPKAAAPERKTIRWTEERDVALLTQISSAGVKSFVTNKANDNVRAKKKGKKLEEKPVEP